MWKLRPLLGAFVANSPCELANLILPWKKKAKQIMHPTRFVMRFEVSCSPLWLVTLSPLSPPRRADYFCSLVWRSIHKTSQEGKIKGEEEEEGEEEERRQIRWGRGEQKDELSRHCLHPASYFNSDSDSSVSQKKGEDRFNKCVFTAGARPQFCSFLGVFLWPNLHTAPTSTLLTHVS